MRPICLHCCKRIVSRPRGLCFTCYYTPGVKEMYPGSGNKYGKRNRDHYGPGVMPIPTTALPGTPEKEAVLTERAAKGQRLYHPDDATWSE